MNLGFARLARFLLSSSSVTSWAETAFFFGVGLLSSNWVAGGSQLGTIGSLLSKTTLLFGGSITALNWLVYFCFLGKPKNPPIPPRPTAIIWQIDEEEPERKVSLPIPIPLKSKGLEQIADTSLAYNNAFLEELSLRSHNQGFSNGDLSIISDLDLSPIHDKESSPQELSMSPYSINDLSIISDLDLSPILDEEYSTPNLSISLSSTTDLSISLSSTTDTDLSISLSSTTDTDLSISPLSASVGVDDYFPEGAWDENDLDFPKICIPIAGADETSAPRARPIESGEVEQNVDKRLQQFEGALTHHKTFLSERDGNFFKFKRRIHSSGDLRNYIPKNSPVQKVLLIRAQSDPLVKFSSSRAPRNRNPDIGALPGPGTGRLLGKGESSATGHHNHKICPD